MTASFAGRTFFAPLSLFMGLLCSGPVLAETVIPGSCAPVGRWTVPGENGGQALALPGFIAGLAQKHVVLLGESHDSFEDHRWQLQTLAALYAQQPNLVLGLEMFPRRVQAALDRWVAGTSTEAEFLNDSDWRQVWNFDPALYMPLFDFARMNRIPMLAMNVDLKLPGMVGQQGWDAVPEAMREGVTRPAPASEGYRDELATVFQAHGAHGAHSGMADGSVQKFDPANPRFVHFVESQQTWDRAMAQAIQGAVQKADPPLLVGILGAGHVLNGYGVQFQLKDLGVQDSVALLPWERNQDCTTLRMGVADAVFGIDAPAQIEVEKPHLGLMLENGERGAMVKEIVPDSVASAAGVRRDDVILEMAGVDVTDSGDINAIVQRQAPGTWLPLKVKRGRREVQLVAKFPASP